VRQAYHRPAEAEEDAVSNPDDADKRAHWFEEHWRKHVPFNVEIGLDITDWAPGHVRARLPYQRKLSAHDGIFHGGVLCSAMDAIGWLNINLTTMPLMSGEMTGTDWAKLGTSVLVWVGVPLAIGTRRVLTREVK